MAERILGGRTGLGGGGTGKYCLLLKSMPCWESPIIAGTTACCGCISDFKAQKRERDTGLDLRHLPAILSWARGGTLQLWMPLGKYSESAQT